MEDFKTMAQIAVESAAKATSLMAYCDYIANSIKLALPVTGVSTSAVKSDLHPEGGYLLTTKKTIEAEYLGKKYKITVEEA
jgi:hypothetical protein